MLTTVLIGIFLAFLTRPLPDIVHEFDLHTIHPIHKWINFLIGFNFSHFVFCVQHLKKSQVIDYTCYLHQLFIHIRILYPSSHTCTCTPVGILLQLGKVLENKARLNSMRH